ncbi:6-phosphogluconate dehydrogenase (decarboxylating) [Vagococcus elongatus]|uniref:6-phosphogluconate dehydrogenase (Decarboxylating) n=2 Tax=Vagococcus elongatus TaxID=180344 RepID=A0A430ANC2_9ENTE|nr:decarboxylating 6-phosphogluconate dehydrogenase [Vagococcus elongatus]RSU09589.1 6-phosphogluconate dehydrogenase (decarboxylating) [Vagococcus elongatus]
MDVYFIGLGKMGMGIAENLRTHEGYAIYTYDKEKAITQQARKKGFTSYTSLTELFRPSTQRRIVWVMVPAGDITEKVLADCRQHLNPGDILIDAGNSKFTDSIKQHELSLEKNIHFLDVGTSGGMSGARHGACMMIGGDRSIFNEVEQLFLDLCVPDGYLFAGEPGSGHYLKMVHNGIEYGMMQSIGEGFNLLHHSDFDFNMPEVARVFNHGSVIRSWLMELTENLFRETLDFSEVAGIVPSSGEGQWTVEEALRKKVAIPVIAQSLMTRYASEDEEKYNEKVISLLRNQFGGHSWVKDE